LLTLQVIKDFESRKQRIDQLEQQVTTLGQNVQKHRIETDVVRQRWLEPLQDIIGQINTNFSAYFAAMKCAGEVSLSKPSNPVSHLFMLTALVTKFSLCSIGWKVTVHGICITYIKLK